MAQTITDITRSNVTCALDTYNYTVPAAQAGMMTVDVSMDEIPPSSVSIEIKQNNTTKAVTTVPTPPNQENVKLRVVLNCAADDIIRVVLSSIVAQDAGLNRIKAIINIHPGSN